MKKSLTLLLVIGCLLALSLAVLAACDSKNEEQDGIQNGEEMVIEMFDIEHTFFLAEEEAGDGTVE